MLTVAAAIIENMDGKILICKRAQKGSCAGLWEFPGGKLEPEEDPQACAVRECMEELGIRIRITGLFDSFLYHYPDQDIQFMFYKGEMIKGSPIKRVHQELAWVHRRQLGQYHFCPANAGVVKQLAGEE